MQRKWFSLCISILFACVAVLAVVAQPAVAISTTVVISEFRTHGPGGAEDQFIEIYNLSDTAVDITDYSIYAWGFAGNYDVDTGDPISETYLVTQIAATDGITPVVLLPYQHYLLVNGFGYSGSTQEDAGFLFTPPQTDELSLVLLDSSSNVVDAVSTTSDGNNPYLALAGTPLVPRGQSIDQSYERLPGTPGIAPNNGHINTTDKDDSATDFTYNNGSSNPESLSASSPTAVTLRDLTAQAQAPALWLPAALLIVLSGALFVSRRRQV